MKYSTLAALPFALSLMGCSPASPPTASREGTTQGAASDERETRRPASSAQRGLVCGTRKGKDVITMKIANLERHHSQVETWLRNTPHDLDRVLLDDAALTAFAKAHADVEEGWHDPRVSPLVGRSAWSPVMTERLAAARAHVAADEWVEGELGALDAAAAVIDAATDLDELRVMVDDAQIWCLPTTKGTFRPPIDLDFDRNRCSEVHGAELVRVLGSSAGSDGTSPWYLVDVGYTIGWVTAPSWTPALSAADATGFVDAKDAVVVVDDVDWPFGTEHPFQHLHVGARLPRVPPLPADDADEKAPPSGAAGAPPSPSEEAAAARPDYALRVPTPTGFETMAVTPEILRQRSLVTDSLAFTRRNVLELAFRRLGDSYGWGGTRGARDCSRLVLDLLRVFGIRVGRNSGIQARYGSESIDVSGLDPDAKRRAIREAAARGVVLLYMPGHIMLYVGEDAGEDYALSSISEYVTPCSSLDDYVNRLDRVAVTPLSIGKGTVRTSFIERISSIQVYGAPPTAP